MLVSQLIQVLPTLALAAVGLAAIESTPVALAHRAKSGHQHLVARHRMAASLVKRRQASGAGLRKRADGSMCRVRTNTSAQGAPSPTPSSDASSQIDVVAIATSITPDSSPSPSPSASPSAAPQPVQPSSSLSYAGGSGGWTNHGSKFGAGWPNGDWAQLGDANYIANYIGQRTSWYYTWDPTPCGSADALGLEYVPMLHSPSMASQFSAQQASWPSTVKNALFFNEPNLGSQANISPEDSVQYWINYMVPLRARGIALGGAAPTSADSGIQWVKDALTACVNAGNAKADCTPDFYPVHWYGTSAQDFIAYVEKFHQETGLDLWVTEYACQDFTGGAQCDDGQVWSLHQTMASWFDQTDHVQRYAPFGMMANMPDVNQMNALMNPDGSITALGSWYISSS